jgi:hypothetical protein
MQHPMTITITTTGAHVANATIPIFQLLPAMQSRELHKIQFMKKNI